MAYESAPLWTGEYLHPGDAGLPAYAPYGYQWIGKRGMKFTPPVVRGMGTCSDGDPTTGIFNPLDPECWATWYAGTFGSGAAPVPSVSNVAVSAPVAPTDQQLVAGGFTPDQTIPASSVDTSGLTAQIAAAINSGAYNPSVSNAGSLTSVLLIGGLVVAGLWFAAGVVK
jgi:hypothetical protein